MTPYLACLLLVGFTLAAREEDLVQHVPHLDPQPDFDNYAGYLDVDGNKKFFYWFVESENDPANDPVVLWLNGGPGCSSLTGKLVELGPWRVHPSGDYLEWFEHRWNKIANIIFMESPQCVGYSYAEDNNCTSSDDQTAHDNHMALKDFFEGWPELADNDFYITGESYAGFYVPTLAARVMDDEDFNFKGFAVGNAVTDYDIMDNALVYFTWVRGLFATPMQLDLLEHCCEGRNWTFCDFTHPDQSQECNDLMRDVSRIVWSSGLNPYNLYEDCYGGAAGLNGIIDDSEEHFTMVHPGTLPIPTEKGMQEYLEFYNKMRKEHPNFYSSIPCTDTSDRETYLNKPEVRNALHVENSVPEWTACSSRLSYDRQYRRVQDEYLKILAGGHRALVFNGDLDMACNHHGDLWFVENLGIPMLDEYKAWHYDDDQGTYQIAGYVQQHENIKFLTVKGAGHFVPTDKPWPAYIMWEKFINDEDY